MEKNLLEELKKLIDKEGGYAQTTGERVLAAILLDIYERENEDKEDWKDWFITDSDS